MLILSILSSTIASCSQRVSSDQLRKCLRTCASQNMSENIIKLKVSSTESSKYDGEVQWLLSTSEKFMEIIATRSSRSRNSFYRCVTLKYLAQIKIWVMKSATSHYIAITDHWDLLAIEKLSTKTSFDFHL